jgi:hypothetical protein
MTADDTPAAPASPAFDQESPSAAISSTRRRSGVMRCGGGPASRTPSIGRSGRSASGERSTMRSTMPRGTSVYSATQSTKRMSSSGRGGVS